MNEKIDKMIEDLKKDRDMYEIYFHRSEGAILALEDLKKQLEESKKDLKENLHL